jgi:hypothetical protein
MAVSLRLVILLGSEITERLPSLACFFLLLCFVLSCRLEPMDFHLRDPFPMLASSTRTFDRVVAVYHRRFAPAGSTRVSVHVKPSARSTWFHMLSTDIFGPATNQATVKLLSLYLRHSRERIWHTVWLPTQDAVPTAFSTDLVITAARDLAAAPASFACFF